MVDEPSLVFNIVWTGSVFPYLRYFVASQIHHSRARFRFVANGCPDDQIALMQQFAEQHPDRVVEVLDVSSKMIAHGVALDAVRSQRDDGEHFSLIDPDIKANGPFVADLARHLVDGCVAVTSGKEVWSDGNVLPEGHPGVPGEVFFDREGFVFGSPHLAIYRRDALDETADRWQVGLGSAGPELVPEATARLAEMGHHYKVYDTAKLVNVLLQADDQTLVHEDLPQLVHIGGLSHYLAPTGYITQDDGEVVPNWSRWGKDPTRYDVARFTAAVLRSLVDGDPMPEVPTEPEGTMMDKLRLVRAELIDLIGRYGEP